MPAFFADAVPPDEYNATNDRAIAYLKERGAILPDNFYSNGMPQVSLSADADDEVHLADFEGCMVFGDGCGLNSGHISPFPHGIVRLSCRKAADGTVSRITVGDGTELNGTSVVCSQRITIGRNVLFGPNVVVMDSDGHEIDRTLPDHGPGACAPVVIEDHAWVGLDAMILKGVTVGHHAVVAARSVVTKDVPPHAIVAGNPARVIKVLHEEEPSE